MKPIHITKKQRQGDWNDLGYFEEGLPIRIGWFKQFLEAYRRLGWDIAQVHPGMDVSKILESEVVDRGAITRLIDHGYQHAGAVFPLLMGKIANFTALGEVGWMMLTAPTIRHAIGTLCTFIPTVDTQVTIETTDDADRFVMRVRYDLESRRHRELSTLIFASALSKFVNAFHGDVFRGNLMTALLNCPTVTTSALQEIYWIPVRNEPRSEALEISFDSEFASMKNVNFDERPWENSKLAMRKLYGAEIGVTKADRYAQLLMMHVTNWNYQRDGKPKLAHILKDMKISERGLRTVLSEGGYKIKDVMMKAEARRIYLAIKRGHSMTEAAEIYGWSNVTNMKKMVSEQLGKDLKTVKPFKYIDS